MSEILLQTDEFEQVAQRVAPGSHLRRVWSLDGGISANMVALEIETAVGSVQRIIIRQYSDAHHCQNPQIAADEYRLLQITQAQGLATPVPYFCDQTGQIFSRPYLALEYIEGEMTFSPPDWAHTVRQLAAQLVKIHQVDPAKVDLSFLPERGNRCAELDRKRLYEVDPSSLEGRIKELLEEAGPFAQENAPTLLHGDFWPGNSLWHDGKLVAVIDWEDAGWGDPLIDLAQSRAEIVWIFGIEEMQLFTREYQSIMLLNDKNLRYWDLCAALRVLRIAGGDLTGLASYFVPYGRADITAESIEENLLLLIN